MNLILIGGKDNLNNGDIIEKYIFNSSISGNVLLVPAASMDDKGALEKFKTGYGRHFKNIDCLYLYSDLSKEEMYSKLDFADTIFFSGGNTKHLVDKIKEFEIDAYLKKTSKLLVGVSAGANMLAFKGMGDSESYQDNFHQFNYKIVDGIGLFNAIICPHYNHPDLEIFNDILWDYDIDAYALDDDTLIHYNNGILRVVKANKKRSVYSFLIEENRVMRSLYEKRSIAVLGPEGTFSDVACHKYLNKINEDIIPIYYPSIKKTTEAITNTHLAILPFENTLDGFVLDSIDGLIKNDYHIISDLNTKVEFAFVSKAKDINDVKHVFVQFKAKGQCLDFLTMKNDFKIITTESNIESLNNLEEYDESYGAIIPMHKINDVKFNIIIKNVEDRVSNYTRFIVVSTESCEEFFNNRIKCSLCIFMNEERPGLLFELLKIFNDHKLNLTAIISRPTKEELGKYNFYIEIESEIKDLERIKELVSDLSKGNYKVKNLGIYSSIGDE